MLVVLAYLLCIHNRLESIEKVVKEVQYPTNSRSEFQFDDKAILPLVKIGAPSATTVGAKIFVIHYFLSLESFCSASKYFSNSPASSRFEKSITTTT
jgi:hypothetical protein